MSLISRRAVDTLGTMLRPGCWIVPFCEYASIGSLCPVGNRDVRMTKSSGMRDTRTSSDAEIIISSLILFVRVSQCAMFNGEIVVVSRL